MALLATFVAKCALSLEKSLPFLFLRHLYTIASDFAIFGTNIPQKILNKQMHSPLPLA